MRRQPTEEQKAKAAERRAAFRDLARQIAAMTDEQRGALAARAGMIATVEGHTLSLVNTLLLASQRPGITLVGGFRQWKRAGRSVRRGEHGLALWIPTTKTTAQDSDTLEQPGGDGTPGEARPLLFIMGTVFDVSQTEEVA